MDKESDVLYRQNPDTLDIVVERLKNDEVIVLPCDTIYGLCAKMGPAEEKLYALKERDQRKPFLILATLEQAKAICDVPADIEACWPCALTAIMDVACMRTDLCNAGHIRFGQGFWKTRKAGIAKPGDVRV